MRIVELAVAYLVLASIGLALTGWFFGIAYILIKSKLPMVSLRDQFLPMNKDESAKRYQQVNAVLIDPKYAVARRVVACSFLLALLAVATIGGAQVILDRPLRLW